MNFHFSPGMTVKVRLLATPDFEEFLLAERKKLLHFNSSNEPRQRIFRKCLRRNKKQECHGFSGKILHTQAFCLVLKMVPINYSFDLF